MQARGLFSIQFGTGKFLCRRYRGSFIKMLAHHKEDVALNPDRMKEAITSFRATSHPGVCPSSEAEMASRSWILNLYRDFSCVTGML
ncbi:unnamed protein product [Clonostachys rosea f. rosea IK726]|uniref:Uncharacterized protein n=1 Tax=Clonostachys rosea f. rosea IK726 TaxID=1349383 RepID=A0ACA9TD68_BIOOC|nr:unnamed protein product [Clonostachys rosea f. rosea IK726]